MADRDSFIFYRSFYESIKRLPNENQLEIYTAIMEYALNQNEIEVGDLSEAMFTLIKPQLEANYKRFINGSKAKVKQNESKTEANNKQNKSKTVTNVNVNDNVNVNVNENVNNIIRVYEEEIGFATQNTIVVLDDYLDTLSEEMIIKAIKLASAYNKKSLKYVEGILNNWVSKGYKTVSDIQDTKKKEKKYEYDVEFANLETLYDN